MSSRAERLVHIQGERHVRADLRRRGGATAQRPRSWSKDSQLSDRHSQKVGYTEVRVAKLSLVDRLLQEEVAELRQRFK